ncbi:hypothetical protein PF010_g10882 [Phytophthora fragariae]|nr:hypothetical protein PF010_g10882 [Phytophthora fragariae]KAE9113096.1 hypothetical protein PF007_g10844 [Phytophthora fragariae]KAE9144829.1 hypothetical protein PF006_g10273 [Phytophthora fragariae]
MSERSSSQAGAQPSSKHTRARDVLFEDFEEGMVSPTEDQEGSPGAGHSPQSCSRSRSPARPPPRSPLRTPNPFPERDTGAPALRNAPPLPSRDDAEGSNVNTNDLDGAQSRQLEVRREASKSNIPAALPLVKKSKDYHFGGSKSPAKEATELAKDSLVEYVIGPAARSDKELAKRDTWCKRLLTPQTTSPAEYCARLDAQLAKSSVPQINRIPVVLLREAASHRSGARHAHRAMPEDEEPSLDPRALRRQLDELQEQARVNREFRHWAADKFDRYADDVEAVERGLHDLADQAT